MQVSECARASECLSVSECEGDEVCECLSASVSDIESV